MNKFGTIKWSTDMGYVSVSLIGEIEGYCFNEFLRECETSSYLKLLLDFSKVTYIDSSAIGKILSLKQLFGEHIYVCEMPEFVKKLFNIMKINSLFKTFKDKYTAIESLQEIPEIEYSDAFYSTIRSNIHLVYIGKKLALDNNKQFSDFITKTNLPYIIVDFKDCKYLDSTGFTSFTIIHKKFKKNACLCNIAPNILKLFKLVKFDKLFTIKDSLHESFKYIETLQTESNNSKSKLRYTIKENICVITPKGNLNETFVDQIKELNLSSVEKVIIDLTEVKIVTTNVLSSFLILYKKFSKKFALYKISDTVLVSLKQFKFDSFMHIIETKEKFDEFIKPDKKANKLKGKGLFTLVSKVPGEILTVYPPNKKLEPVKFEDVLKKINEKNIEVESRETIKKIVNAAEGIPYKISKKDLNISPVIIELSEDNMKASIFIQNINSNNFPDYEDLTYALKKNNILLGASFDILKKISIKKIHSKLIPIAEGCLVEDGSDEKINFLVDIESKVKPSELLDGSVNFYEINTIQNISQDQILLERIPPKEGKDGYTVTGDIIKAIHGKSAKIHFGENTYLSEDKTKLFSKISGHLFYNENSIDIHTVLKIDNNVDFKTGNIDYNGNVFVAGNVKSGFSIKANGNIEIRGEVESASLNAVGNITIHKGVFGHNKAKIECGQDLICNSIQECEVIVGKNMIVKGEIRLSNIIISHSLFMILPRSSIIGGSIVAGENINATSIGVTSNTYTEVFLDNVPQYLILRKKENILAEIKKDKKYLSELISIVNNGPYAESRYKNSKNKELFIDELSKINRLKKDIDKKTDMLGFYTKVLTANESKLKEIKLEINTKLAEIESELKILKDEASNYISDINKNIQTLSRNDINSIEKYYEIEDLNEYLNYKINIIESLLLKFNPLNKIRFSHTCFPGVKLKISNVEKNIRKKYEHSGFKLENDDIKITKY